MNGLPPTSHRHGFSVTDLLVVIACVAILAVPFLLHILGSSSKPGARQNCANCLKQINLAFRTWAIDHNDRFPMQESVTNGGTMELTGTGAISPVFQALSNELSTPKILVCPVDKRRRAATNFAALTDANLSYFLNIDSTDTKRNFLLAGDRNLTNQPTPGDRFVRVSAATSLGWSKDLHVQLGNISFLDGSVTRFTNGAPALASALRTMGTATNRLAMP